MKSPSVAPDHATARSPLSGGRWIAACLLLFAAACSPKPAATEAAKPSDGPTEQRWIIGSIARDLADMTAAAADPAHWTPLPDDAVDVRPGADVETGTGYTLTLRLPGGGDPVRSDLKVIGTVWTPGLYVPTLQTLFTRLKITPPAAEAGAPPDTDLLKVLTHPLTAELEAHNRQISAWLQEHPLDARAHDQAALLLGTLAMRENAGYLWDPRGSCNRAAAHLAMARALHPEPSACGEVAELLIGLILDTKADCQQRIAALQARVAAHPELDPWVRAAALRNTRDYRLLADPKKATLLERIELFRAQTEAIDTDRAVVQTLDYSPATAPDWSRIVLEGNFGVDSGHRFALPSTGLELKDAETVFPEVRKARTPEQFAAIFNQAPGGAVRAGEDHRAQWNVIDRGTWARFFQRHLLQAADQTYHFLKDKWGVPDEAQQFRAQVAPLLRPLTLYPLLLEHLGQADREELSPRVVDLLTRHPEWVSDGAWSVAVHQVPARSVPGGNWTPVSQAWFSPRLPTGTVYGFDGRVNHGEIMPPPELAELTRYYQIAPLKYSVCWNYMSASATNHHATPEQFKAAMGDLPSYYVPVMWGGASLVENDPAQYGALMKRAAALDPGYYINLGKYYLDHHMEPEAAQAYQGAIDHEADAVTLSNSCEWLVNYYYDHGQQDRAMTIARQMAEIYSGTGLETMAGLLEKMHRDPEAESYYEKIQERYNDARPLHAFYRRAAARDPVYAEKLKAEERKVFPQGMEAATMPQFSGKPADGVLVNGENARSRRSNLKLGAIIVALDGKRVHNRDQYDYVRALTESPDMDLIVYQDEHYLAIHAKLPERRFGVDFKSWP